MSKKIRVGVVLGGKNLEHEVSIRSAMNVMKDLDKSQFELIVMGIDKKGDWFFLDYDKLLKIYELNNYISLSDHRNIFIKSVNFSQLKKEVDIIFPVLHGKFGEDGCVQGFLKTLDVPFVGSGVLATSICMDKEVSKRLLDFENIPVSKYLIFTRSDKYCLDDIVETLGLPIFVKPSNSGSSVGISRAKTKEELKSYLEKAFDFDHKVILEEEVKGIEIETSVLGNENPKVAKPSRIIPTHEFYNYEAKCIDPDGALFELPAKLTEEKTKEVQEIAIMAYKALRCDGLARIDFFIRDDGQVLLNEINTIPGFTNTSMYPEMWKISGLSFKEVVTELIRLGLDKFRQDNELLTNVETTLEEKSLIKA